MADLVGRLIHGRYRIEKLIARGGMATVYIAEDNRLDRKVALKVIHPHLASDVVFREKFVREAKTAAKLSHPNLVNVFDQAEDGDIVFLAMEYVSGITLRQALDEFGSLTPSRALDVFEPIIAGLAAAHGAGILHRDIKPENVLLSDDGRIKLSDFGLARPISAQTQTGGVVGTVAYLSPELVSRGIADARSDIYSTGCLLFELLTGQPPFSGETPVSIAYQHVSGEVPSARSIQPDLPADVDKILKVALAKKAEDRYQSAQSMLDDLLNLHQGRAVTAKIAAKPFFTRRSALLYGGSFFAAIALSITGFLLSGTQDSGPLIPNVVGLSEADARKLLDGYVITIKRAHDGTIPKDRVASQSPLATTHALKGSAIVLTISDGPGDAIVPDDLVGMALIDARAALTAVGLTVTQTIAAPSDQPQGTVLDVSPPVGSVTTAGSGVILTIASGDVAVPNLVGVEAIQAKTTLIQVGFLIKEFYDYDSTQPLGVVIRQAPDAGTTQTIGKSVTITINKQP